jgi:hypothetical protein
MYVNQFLVVVKFTLLSRNIATGLIRFTHPSSEHHENDRGQTACGRLVCKHAIEHHTHQYLSHRHFSQRLGLSPPSIV